MSHVEEEIPFCSLDLEEVVDPVPSILASQEYAAATAAFIKAPAAERALVSAQSQALLYTLVRTMKPAHVVEIGSYKVSTAEAICRGLMGNGAGMLHTIDPYGQASVPPLLADWTPELRQHVTFYPMNSMAFFEEAERLQIRPGIVFVDGNHDYEFAYFDVLCAARRLQPGGFIAIDNISQSGPYLAAVDFLAGHSDWVECRELSSVPDPTKAFDPGRTKITNSDFMILRAPRTVQLIDRPYTFGEVPWQSNNIEGVRIQLGHPVSEGKLHAQVVFRAFGHILTEEYKGGEKEIGPEEAGQTIEIRTPMTALAGMTQYRVEPWLIWHGEEPLKLASAPVPF